MGPWRPRGLPAPAGRPILPAMEPVQDTGSSAAGDDATPLTSWQVQAWGRPRVIDDVEWLRAQLGQLTQAHEGPRAAPWHVSDAPENFVAAQIKGIVGIEIPVRRILGKWKVSQNRQEADRQGVARGLRAEGLSQAMAELVERR